MNRSVEQRQNAILIVYIFFMAGANFLHVQRGISLLDR